jgi:hypothetical protein
MARATARSKPRVLAAAFRQFVAMRPKGPGGAPRIPEPELWYASLLFVGARTTLQQLRAGRRPRQGKTSGLVVAAASELKLTRLQRRILGQALAKSPSEVAWEVVWGVMGRATPSDRAIRGYLRTHRNYVAGMVAAWHSEASSDEKCSANALELLNRGASLALDHVVRDVGLLEKAEYSSKRRSSVEQKG